MLGAEWQCIDLVYLLEAMVVHHSAVVVVLRAFFTQPETLVAAVNLGLSVLATHALEVPLHKLFFVSHAEMYFVLEFIFLGIIDHEVVLKRIFFAIAFK